MKQPMLPIPLYPRRSVLIINYLIQFHSVHSIVYDSPVEIEVGDESIHGGLS
jgi:hypothetical protein